MVAGTKENAKENGRENHFIIIDYKHQYMDYPYFLFWFTIRDESPANLRIASFKQFGMPAVTFFFQVFFRYESQGCRVNAIAQTPGSRAVVKYVP
jgi:hypothetical protein